MKRFLITCSLFFVSLLGATTTYTFGDTSKALTNTSNWKPTTPPWSNLTTTACKQRYYGVGIGSIIDSRSMGMVADFKEDAIPVKMVSLTCYASSANATGKIATISVTALFADQTTETAACIFETTTQSTIDAPAPYTLTFTFQSTALLSQLTITNTSADNCYLEVGSVSFHRTTPKIEATIDVAEYLFAGTTASASVVSLEGGDGIYEDYTFCWFLDDEPISEDGFFIAQTLREPFSFVVPEEEGEHTVTFRVIDANGNITDTVATFKSDVQTPPSNINITNVTRTGFDVSWEVSGPVAPAEHRVRLIVPGTIDTTLTPSWSENANGEAIARFSLEAFSKIFLQGLIAIEFSTPLTFSTAPLFSLDGENWQSTFLISEAYHIFNFTDIHEKEAFYLKLAADEILPQTLNFIFESENPPPQFDETLRADGHNKSFSFENLPSGALCKLVLDAVYANGETKTEEKEIQLPKLDPFIKIQKWENLFYFTWPTDKTITTGAYSIYANIPAERQGVFLSRLFHATGALGGKGIVITNTTNEEVDLCTYTLRYTRPNGTTADWVMKDQILPAKSERIFVYPGIKINTPEDVKESSATAMNFTNGGVLTLINGGESINSLNVKSKHISRLNASTQGETFTAYADDAEMESLWSIWTPDPITVTCEIETGSLARDGETTQKTIDINKLCISNPNAIAFWLEGYTIENDTTSDVLTQIIWEKEVPLKGYLLRLR